MESPETPDLLIVGGESDPNTCRLVDMAHLRQVPYFFWDTDRPGADRVAWDFDEPVIDLGEHRLSPRACFLRFNVFDSGDNTPAASACFHCVQSYLAAWPGVRMINRDSHFDANNKSANLRLAREMGLTIPTSTVLGNLEPLMRHPDPRETIMKPLDGGDHTRTIDRFIEAKGRPDTAGPQFVQQRLPGDNYRVFVIGQSVFGFRLETDQIDYREDPQVQVIASHVPTEIADQSKRLAQKKSMDYCALDFREDASGQWVFLEVNSFPMFVRFDDAAENRLSDAMIELLSGTTSSAGSSIGKVI